MKAPLLLHPQPDEAFDSLPIGERDLRRIQQHMWRGSFGEDVAWHWVPASRPTPSTLKCKQLFDGGTMGDVIKLPVDARGCEDALRATLGPEYPPEVQDRFIAAMRAPAVAMSFHRGYRIVAVQLGNAWVGTVYAPGSDASVSSSEGASAQEVMVRGTEAVNTLLAASAG